MDKVSLTGGARIGMANATWPFATLDVTKDRLELNASIIGNIVFRPEDVVSIEPYYQMPIIGQGIKINHRIPKYNEKVVFWTFKNPNEVIRQIKQTGFGTNSTIEHSNQNSQVFTERQNQGGFPVKIPFAIGLVFIWNTLFIIDFINYSKNNMDGIPLGNGALGALGLVFLSCLLTLISKSFRKIVLKEGRELKDISKFLYFLMFISGFMIVSILTFPK